MRNDRAAGMRLWIDESPADIDGLATVALINYGHFTAMQVRDGCVRGLARHLSRVDEAHRELFGHGLDRDRVREQWARAAAHQADAYLRATFFDDAQGAAHALIVMPDPSSRRQRPTSVSSWDSGCSGPQRRCCWESVSNC